MKITNFLALAVTLLPYTNANCLSSQDADTLATNFGTLISAYTQKLANQTLAVNFVDYSESVNTLIDNGGAAPQALLGPTFTSRAAFEAGSAAQPSVPFTVKNIWYTCNVITVRWESDQSPQPIMGISILQTVYNAVRGNPSNFQINEVWAEFDSAAWLVDLGFTITPPSTKKEKREVTFEA